MIAAVINTASGVANEIYTRLARIQVLNDFETDIGTRVMRGRRTLPAPDEIPCVQVFEAGDDATDYPNRLSCAKMEQIYVIDSFDICDIDNPNDKAHALLRDMKRVIFTNGKRDFDGAVMRVDYITRDIAPRAEGTSHVQARLVIKVHYVEDLSKP